MIEVDYSPLNEMKFNCLDKCGFCCTFQPELMKNEFNFYKKNIITRDAIISGSISDPTAKEKSSFSLQNKIGGCVFLKEKKCQIYDIRPLTCKTFPINIFFGWRIQLNPNMCCRGLWDGERNINLSSFGQELFSSLHINFVRQLFHESKKKYNILPKELKSNYISPNEFRNELLKHVKTMRIKPYEYFEKIKILFEENLTGQDFNGLPTYLNEDLDWNIFKFKDDIIQRIQLEENGNFKIIDAINISNVDKKTISSEGMDLIKKYIELVAGRDNFIGSIYFQLLSDGTESLLNSAIINLKYIYNILAINSSMLAEFYKKEEIDKKIVKEGIIITDGSISIAPTIGRIV